MRSLLFCRLAAFWLPPPARRRTPCQETSVHRRRDRLSDWRRIGVMSAPENLILIETVHGDVVIELNPDFAPKPCRAVSRSGARRCL